MTIIYEAFYDNDVIVTLTNEEIDAAARHGIAMRKFSLANGHKDRHGFGFRPPTEAVAIKAHAVGALCEAAMCRALGLPIMLTAQTYSVPDLPGNIQVRLIGHNHYGLRVYPDDKPHWKVAGVVIPPGWERKAYRLPGWIKAGEAHQHKEWEIAPFGGPPMFAVPQKDLYPLGQINCGPD